ncbi:MAG: bacteriohemerythrin [Candidatus Sulfotelmatobacter sp.]
MKGTIVKCMEELVINRFGAEKWREALKKAGLSEWKTFTMLSDMDESEFMRIMEGVASAASLSMEQTMEAFGEHWSTVYAPTVYRAYFSSAKSARELLLNLDHIHDVMTKSMKSARPPRFRYEWKGDKHLVMHYESQRGLVVLMPSLIRGVGKHFNEKLTATIVGNAVHVQFAELGRSSKLCPEHNSQTAFPSKVAPMVADISAGATKDRGYKIEQTQIGFKLTFGDIITKQDLELWLEESKKALDTRKKPFGVIADMRNLELLAPAVQAEIVKGQMLYHRSGLLRSAVILRDPIVTIQFMRMAKKSGVYKYERYIDASSDAQWEKHAEEWVNSGIDLPLVTWDSSYSVNVAKCDEDHQKLFSLLNNLHGAMKAGEGREVIQRVVKDLADYTRYHFSQEEMLLSETNYPDLILHKAQHSIFVKKVEKFQSAVKAGDLSQLEVTEFLKDWLVTHIKQADRQYSAHLNANGLS